MVAPQRLQEPLNAQVYQRLKWRLIVGDYVPGDSISIRRIATELGVGTMPAREALKRLASERALASSANRSFRVIELEPKHIADLFFIRSHLEGIATELATPLLTQAQIDRLAELGELAAKHIEEKDAAAYLARNYTFHFSIYTAAGNQELVSIIESLWVQTCPFLAEGVRRVGISRDWRLLHTEITQAIRARDSVRARALIEQDINWGTEIYKDLASAGSDGVQNPT